MKKKTIALAVIVLCLCTVMPTFIYAGGVSEGFADEYYRLQDTDNLLSLEEKDEILNLLDEVSRRMSFDLAIITLDSLEGYSARDRADDIYDLCSFGYGLNRDGAMLLVSMSEREWYITTCGYGITVFTDAGIAYIGEQISGYLADGDYAEAFRVFISLAEEFITQAESGEPFDSSTLPREPLSAVWIVISLAVGFVIALIVVGVMKGKLKTVRSQVRAENYVREGSVRVTESSDLFLYHTVNRRARPKNNDSGSSTHVSSSGTTHGGGGGKF